MFCECCAFFLTAPTDMTIRLAQQFDLTLICVAHPDLTGASVGSAAQGALQSFC